MDSNTNRYTRQEILPQVGEAGQAKIRQAKVLIIGLGGLGCPVAQYLTGAGIGELGLIDGDLVEASNLHRQLLYTEADLGKPKVEKAKEHLLAINSEVKIETYVEAFNAHNALTLLSGYDIIVDATDNFQSKYLINDACMKAGKPWVYGSIYKFQGQLAVFNFENGPSLRCAFPQAGATEISCEETGVLGVLPGVLGTLQAAEVLKMILGIGEVLSGKLKLTDLLKPSETYLKIRRNETAIQEQIKKELTEMKFFCEFKNKNRRYLDVRESHEMPQPADIILQKIPLKELAERHAEIPRTEEVHVFCQSGARSQKAIELLEKEFGFHNLINVPGGIQSLIK